MYFDRENVHTMLMPFQRKDIRKKQKHVPSCLCLLGYEGVFYRILIFKSVNSLQIIVSDSRTTG